MGSLAFATAVGGLGKGMTENVKHSRDVRREDLDRDHDLQLEAQRAKNYRDLQQNAQTYSTAAADIQQKRDVGMADTRVTRELGMADKLYGRQQGMASADMAGRERMNTQDNVTALYGKMLDQYTTETSRKGVQSNGWTIKFTETESTFGPSGEIIPGKTVIHATDPQSRVWNQVGDKMFRGGAESRQLTDFGGDIGKQRAAEAPLYSGEITEQIFEDTHGYLPADWLTGLAMKSKGVSGWMEKRGIKMPAFMLQSDSGQPTKTNALSDAAMPPPLPAPPSNAPPGGALNQAAVQGEPAAPSNEPLDAPPPPPSTTAPVARSEYQGKWGGAKQLRDLNAEKPWIKNAIIRRRMGLPPLDVEQAASTQ